MAGRQVTAVLVDDGDTSAPSRAFLMKDAATGDILFAADMGQGGRLLLPTDLGPFSVSDGQDPIGCSQNSCGRLLYFTLKFASGTQSVELQPGGTGELTIGSSKWKFLNVSSGAYGSTGCPVKDLRPWAFWKLWNRQFALTPTLSPLAQGDEVQLPLIDAPRGRVPGPMPSKSSSDLDWGRRIRKVRDPHPPVRRRHGGALSRVHPGPGRLPQVRRAEADPSRRRRTTKFVKMFLDEARITAAFTHANIGQVFDLGEERRRAYLAMEFIAGPEPRAGHQARGAAARDASPIGFAARVVRDAALGAPLRAPLHRRHRAAAGAWCTATSARRT